MLKKYKYKTIILIILGFILNLGTFITIGVIGENAPVILGLLFLLSFFIICTGCIYWAKGKGYHGAWGIIGIFGGLGIMILALFRDKTKIKSLSNIVKNLILKFYLSINLITVPIQIMKITTVPLLIKLFIIFLSRN